MEESVLIVRPGALGDTILTLPLIDSIRRKNSEAEITVLGNGAYRDLVPAGAHLEPIDGRRWLGLFGSPSVAESTELPQFDCAYVILHQPESVIDNLRRAGSRSVVHVSSRPEPGVHVVEHLHQGLGFSVPPRRPALIHMRPERKEDLIWVHPGSGGSGKCLRLESMEALARALQASLGGRLAITVGEADGFLMKDPHWKSLTERPDTLWFHNRPLQEICVKLGGARFFVGNDSGVSHLAAALGIPSLVVFVRSDPAQWEPWAPSSNVRVMDLRDSNDSWEALESGLSDLGGLGGAAKRLIESEVPETRAD